MSTVIETPTGNIHFMLDEFMKRHNMKVSDLAELLDKKYNQALNIKNGNINSISFEVLATLCKHFNCEAGQIIRINNTNKYSIETINKERDISADNSLIKIHGSTPISVKVHILYAIEEEYIIYACPEVEVYGDFIPENLTLELSEYQPAVLEQFKTSFLRKKEKFKNRNEFLLRMQQRQYWKLDEKTSSFQPMPLDYYIKEFYAITSLVNDHQSKIIAAPLEINFDT